MIKAEQWGNRQTGIFARCTHCGEVIAIEHPEIRKESVIKNAIKHEIIIENGHLTVDELSKLIFKKSGDYQKSIVKSILSKFDEFVYCEKSESWTLTDNEWDKLK